MRVLQIVYGIACFGFWTLVMGYIHQLQLPLGGGWDNILVAVVVLGWAVFGVWGTYLNRYVLSEDAGSVLLIYAIALVIASMLQLLSSDLRFPGSFETWLRFAVMFLSLASGVYFLGRGAEDKYSAQLQ